MNQVRLNNKNTGGGSAVIKYSEPFMILVIYDRNGTIIANDSISKMVYQSHTKYAIQSDWIEELINKGYELIDPPRGGSHES